MIIDALQIDQHIALGVVVADTLNKAAAWRVRAYERLQVDSAPIRDVYRLRADGFRGKNNVL